LALVNPQVGTRVETVKREGVDIVFAIDVSKSMLAEDVQPSRLERAKLAISRTLDELVSDRVGIITYAGQAYPQLPITTDYGAARLFLRNINTNLIPSQGTAIGEAIELATQYFDDADQKNRLLIILSDGEDHEEGIQDAIEQARENQIRVYTVAIGTERGGPIPIYSRGGRTGFKKDQNGEVVITKLNTALLKEIADQGDGELWDGNGTRSLVSKISDEIAIMEKKEFETTLFSDYEDQFQWFLAPALLLLIIELLILDRKTHWFQKLNLFNEDESPID
jgi:Ca-activated chloride channel family protein